MKIGIIIGRVGGVDGVALETEKWIHILQKMGHEIFLLSGEYEREVDLKNTTRLPVLSFFSRECLYEQDKAFYKPDSDPKTFLKKLNENSDEIAVAIQHWAHKNGINILLSENASSLPSHLSLGMGIKRVVENTGIPLVAHNHDFAWERGDRYVSRHEAVNTIIAANFPFVSKNVRQAVINLNAQKTLQEKFSVDSVVVPNVMDFSDGFGKASEHGQTLRADLGLNERDIVLMQVTRIVERKSIETAIELLHQLNNPAAKLLVTGSAKDDHEGKYYQKLVALIGKYHLEQQVRFVGDQIRHCTSFISNQYICKLHEDGKKIFSLSDAYSQASACTYFSTYEGFGNAFVEAIAARKPIFVNNYQPVFWPDIGSKGFKIVMLENNQLTADKVEEIRSILSDPARQKEITDFNFELGKKYFSYATLEQKLQTLFSA